MSSGLEAYLLPLRAPDYGQFFLDLLQAKLDDIEVKSSLSYRIDKFSNLSHRIDEFLIEYRLLDCSRCRLWGMRCLLCRLRRRLWWA